MFDQINKYKASFGRLFEAKTLKVMLEIALLTILLSFLGPIKNMIYTEVVNKLSLGITVKLGIIMFASYIVVQVIEECVSYFQIYLNTVLQLKLGQSVSHEINNKLAKVKLNSLEMYEIHDLVSRANQTIKSSIVSSLNLIIALYTPLATIVLQLASLVWVAWYVPILIAVFNVPYIFILVKSNHRRYELERKITKEKRVEKYFVELLSDRYAAKDLLPFPRCKSAPDFLRSSGRKPARRLQTPAAGAGMHGNPQSGGCAAQKSRFSALAPIRQQETVPYYGSHPFPPLRESAGA